MGGGGEGRTATTKFTNELILLIETTAHPFKEQAFFAHY
jgi:hypothetical protein